MRQMPEKTEPSAATLKMTTSYDTVHVELPEITSEYHRLIIVSNLYELCQHPPTESSWVIDLSRLKTIDVSLVSVLAALARELGNKSRDVEFVGIRAEALPLDLRKALIQWLPVSGEPPVDGAKAQHCNPDDPDNHEGTSDDDETHIGG